MNATMRFAIVDPSLKDGRGHHFALARRVTESIRANGLVPVWLSHREFAPDGHEGLEVLPIFSISLYDAYRKAPSPKAERGSLGRLLSRANLIARLRTADSALAPGGHSHEQLADDLAAAVEQVGLGPTDRLLFHTADGQTYAAIDLLIKRRPSEALPIFHVCTPYDPVGVMPNPLGRTALEAIIRGWSRRGLLDRRLFLYGENARLANHLALLWNTTVRPLELPALNPLDHAGPAASGGASPQDGRPLEVVYLGPARVEKGFHLLPEIVRHTLDARPEAGCARPIRFTLQCSPQVIGYAPPVLAAIERLRKFGKDAVTLVTDHLGDEAYLRLLAAADVVLLPYGQREYRVRSSGIVSEALSLDKIIVATRETYPASAITHGGGATGATPRELAEAIVEVALDLPGFKGRAREQGAAYRRRNAVEKYVLQCLEAERGAGAIQKVS